MMETIAALNKEKDELLHLSMVLYNGTGTVFKSFCQN